MIDEGHPDRNTRLFRDYKIPDGKRANGFCLDNKPADVFQLEYALRLIEQPSDQQCLGEFGRKFCTRGRAVIGPSGVCFGPNSHFSSLVWGGHSRVLSWANTHTVFLSVLCELQRLGVFAFSV